MREYSSPRKISPDYQELAFARIRGDLVGRLDPVETPFGSKPLVYADWTASGRSLKSIERYMRDKVMPLYGNTHTTTSTTGAQTTAFREEAREIIAEAVNAKSDGGADDDVVLFTGSGTTAAITKIISALSLDKKQRSFSLKRGNRPIVFIGPFEHHSNILPWRESCADVVAIAEDSAGGVDLDDLETKLREYAGRGLKIGSFAAASNLTGALEDTDVITEILHRNGALAFWDYATAAPYVEIDMNPGSKMALKKDAVFISGHKCLGGPGTPGLLVCKKRLFINSSPVVPGGGTVQFVTPRDHTYLTNIEEREEGGTPEILGAIRLGLAFQLKERLGSLEEREEHLTHLGLSTLRAHSRVVVIGDTGRKRLPIFSFLIRHNDRFLHHSFVCKLLNDLFGVQARAGCQCAGPYHMRLLGVPATKAPKVKQQVLDSVGIIKPGSCRLSLTFFMSDAEVKYILDAILFIADYGACFLSQYEPNVTTGEWTHKDTAADSSPKQRLADLTYGLHNTAADVKDKVGLETPSSVDQGILQFFLNGPPKMHVKSVEPVEPVGTAAMPSEEDMFKGHMLDADRLASHMCMARSRPSSTPTRDRSKKPMRIRLPGKKLEVSSRPSFANFRASKAGNTTLNSAAEALRWFALPLDLKTSRNLTKRSRATSTRPVIIPKVYEDGGKEMDESYDGPVSFRPLTGNAN